jgi:hypothetical protein
MCWKVGSVERGERGEGGKVPSSLFFSILGSYSNKIGFPLFSIFIRSFFRLFSFISFLRNARDARRTYERDNQGVE